MSFHHEWTGVQWSKSTCLHMLCCKSRSLKGVMLEIGEILSKVPSDRSFVSRL